MLLDPCHAPVIPGAFGDASMRTHRESKSFTVTVTGGKAYHLLWMPKYHCEASAAQHDLGNLFSFSAVATETIYNTSSTPWGNFTNGSTDYFSLADPVANYVNKSGVRDARTVAACIDVEYTGRTDSEAGQIGSFTSKIGNFWAQAPNDDVPTIPLYSYDDVFDLCENPTRPHAGTTVRWQPNFGTNAAAWFPVNHSPIAIGATTFGSTSASSNHIRDDDPNMIGFAISSAADTQTYRVTLTKIIEYREDTAVGVLKSTGGQNINVVTPPLEKADRKSVV